MSYNLQIFLSKIVAQSIIVGLDMGTKRIGISISDKKHKIATPYLIYSRRTVRKDLGFINDLYKNLNACGIIIGIPFSHSRDNQWAETIEKFAAHLNNKYQINTCLVDESWSTNTANIIDSKKKYLDDISATVILQKTLDLINDLYI